jgi:AraC-like DNA-binding protein
MQVFLSCFVAGSSFLLSFLLFFHPLQQNVKANRMLALFALVMGCAFTSTFILIAQPAMLNSILFKVLNSVQFLLAPLLYFSIVYFVKPEKQLTKTDLIHTVPFIIYTLIEFAQDIDNTSLSATELIRINQNVSFLVRDCLPFQTLGYLIAGYALLKKHKHHLKQVASNISKIDLTWLRHFLTILLLTVLIWINDALFEIPLLTEATPFIYTLAIFFLAFFSIRQKTVFAFGDIELPTSDHSRTTLKNPRLTPQQIENLTAKLTFLMESEKLFLDNDLRLSIMAEKLGLGVHQTSFLINETSGNNFYNFVNGYRVEEAKRLLSSSTIEELNILGIAFASGFNSKTTFNTTFKKVVGVSPSEYARQQHKQGS